jgi:cytidylate kinase
MDSERDITARISERQMRLWNALHSKEHQKNSPPRFITISRDEGTLGDEIAQALSQRLGWRLYDKEIVNNIANNSHVREELVRLLDEKSQWITNTTIVDKIFHLLKIPDSSPFGSDEYHDSLLKTLAALAAHGDAILVGRGANFALRCSEYGFHLRTVGSLEVRIERLSKARQISPESARRMIEDIDAERRAFIRHHFNQDVDDHRHYSIVFNTDHLSVGQVVTSVLSMLYPEVTTIQPGLTAH